MKKTKQTYDDPDETIKFSDIFTFNSILGNGAFGTVINAKLNLTNEICAVKIISKQSVQNGLVDLLKTEAQIISQLDHPNIVKFINIIETEKRIFLVMECIKYGHLAQLFTTRIEENKPFSDEEASIIMRSIVSALNYIHSKDIIHRDLKPENILIDDKDDLSKIKICDFGLSVQYDIENHKKSFYNQCGTKLFMAPELFAKRKYSKPVDIWSCGIIMYMLLSNGKHPLGTDKDTIESYTRKLLDPKWEFNERFTPLAKKFFLKLVEIDPADRLTTEQMMKHPWITRNVNDDIPLTLSEKMRVFGQEQTFARIAKAIVFLYSLKHSKSQKNSPPIKKALTIDVKSKDFDMLDRSPSIRTATTAAGTIERTLSIEKKENSELSMRSTSIKSQLQPYKGIICSSLPTNGQFHQGHRHHGHEENNESIDMQYNSMIQGKLEEDVVDENTIPEATIRDNNSNINNLIKIKLKTHIKEPMSDIPTKKLPSILTNHNAITMQSYIRYKYTTNNMMMMKRSQKSQEQQQGNSSSVGIKPLPAGASPKGGGGGGAMQRTISREESHRRRKSSCVQSKAEIKQKELSNVSMINPTNKEDKILYHKTKRSIHSPKFKLHPYPLHNNEDDNTLSFSLLQNHHHQYQHQPHHQHHQLHLPLHHPHPCPYYHQHEVLSPVRYFKHYFSSNIGGNGNTMGGNGSTVGGNGSSRGGNGSIIGNNANSIGGNANTMGGNNGNTVGGSSTNNNNNAGYGGNESFNASANANTNNMNIDFMNHLDIQTKPEKLMNNFKKRKSLIYEHQDLAGRLPALRSNSIYERDSPKVKLQHNSGLHVQDIIGINKTMLDISLAKNDFRLRSQSYMQDSTNTTAYNTIVASTVNNNNITLPRQTIFMDSKKISFKV